MKINYLLIPTITIFVALAGSFFTSSGINTGWYGSINKPSWTPPGTVIGMVWTIIFILSTISAIKIWNSKASPFNKNFLLLIKIFFVINATLNIFWSYLFFSKHLFGIATWEAALLDVTVIALVILIWPISHASSLLLVPYATWSAFATYLTYSVWALNK